MEVKFEIQPREHISRYLFGSVVYSDTPSDIDVAIIYDKRYVSVKDAIEYRHALEEDMARLNSKKIDTILLSSEEETEVAFLANAKYIAF